MAGKRNSNSVVSGKLKTAISDLRALEKLLHYDELDPHLLDAFRDALNRVRNIAWAAQQSLASKLSEQGSAGVDSLLAAERIRAAYHLCCAIQEDLSHEEIDFQKGQLSELHTVATALTRQIGDRL
ncbi:MAG: hypothetical protein WAU58_02625 [Terriglobales bacterium]